jgi:hypothetical protein
MPNSKWTRGVILAAAGLWVVAAFFMDIPVDRTWLKYLGLLATVVVWGVLAFDLWVWRWLPYWMVKRPNLKGTWKGTYTSSWETPDGPSQPTEFYLVVRQTYSTIHVEAIYAISNSNSSTANITQGEGSPVLWYAYDSSAHALQTSGNPPHRGAARLSIQTEPRIVLAGDYWTSRKTVGRIDLSVRSSKCAGSFAGAQGLTYE